MGLKKDKKVELKNSSDTEEKNHIEEKETVKLKNNEIQNNEKSNNIQNNEVMNNENDLDVQNVKKNIEIQKDEEINNENNINLQNNQEINNKKDIEIQNNVLNNEVLEVKETEKLNEVENIEENKIKEKDDGVILKKIHGIIFHIVAIIAIALFCAAISPKCLQNDTYYTITIGEYIYNNGISDLTQDMYSWHELPYSYPHWLYDLGIFLVYNSFGQAGIYFSTMILTAILGISVYGLCNKKSKNKVISFIVTLGSMYLVKSFVAARAQLVTFILFVWAVLSIEKFLETKKLRYVLMLILIPLLITNLHCAVFPFYFILFLPYIGEYFLVVLEDLDLDLKLFKNIFKLRKKISRKDEKKESCERKIKRVEFEITERKRKRKIIRENPYKINVVKNPVVLLLISVMALSVLTGFLNPAGDGAFTYLYKTLKGNTTASINEHLPLTLVENMEFSIAIVIFLLILIFTDAKIRLSDLFMLAGITILSFNSRRQVSMFALFCGPILANLISQLVYKYDRETFKKIEKFVASWFGATIVICLAIICSTHIIKPTLREDYVDTSSYPVEASDWILKNLDVKNIKLYNEYNYGSYLLFRGIPVFIDSRCDLYSPEFNGEYNQETKEYDGRDIFSDALNIAGLGVNYKTKFKEYGVTHVILYENSKLAMILESDSDYTRIYNKGNFKIFKRQTEEKAVNK